jgi:hypothetical protein
MSRDGPIDEEELFCMIAIFNLGLRMGVGKDIGHSAPSYEKELKIPVYGCVISRTFLELHFVIISFQEYHVTYSTSS